MRTINTFLSAQISDAVQLSQTVERELRSRSQGGDDEDVNSFLLQQADLAATEADFLLKYSGGQVMSSSAAAEMLSRLPVAVMPPHVVEEQTLYSLVFAFSALNAKKAAFAIVSQMAKGPDNAALRAMADQAVDRSSRASEKVWHFLPTRSKIAFNMLTPNEIDPAVETKAASARVI